MGPCTIIAARTCCHLHVPNQPTNQLTYLLYSSVAGLLEHCFYVRPGDEQRSVLAFRPLVAPVKVVLLPLDSRIDKTKLQPIASALTAVGLAVSVDDSGASIGKRYARAGG